MIDLNIHTIYASLTCKTSDLVENIELLKKENEKDLKHDIALTSNGSKKAYSFRYNLLGKNMCRSRIFWRKSIVWEKLWALSLP